MTEISQFLTRSRMERRHIEARLEEVKELIAMRIQFDRLSDNRSSFDRKMSSDNREMDRLKRILFSITQPYVGIREIRKHHGDTMHPGEVVVFDEDTEVLYRMWK
jgi:hypothetical protein